MKLPEIAKTSLVTRLLALAFSLTIALSSWGCGCSNCEINTGAPRAYVEYTYTDCKGVMHSSAGYYGSGSTTVSNCDSVTITLVLHF
jgi:hypothetical protein